MLLFIDEILSLFLDLLFGSVLETAIGWDYVILFGLFEKIPWYLFGFDGFWVSVFDDCGFGSFYTFQLLVFVFRGFGLFIVFVESLADILLLGDVLFITPVHTDGFSELFLGKWFLHLNFLIFLKFSYWLISVSSFLYGRNGRLFTKGFHLRSQGIVRGYY